MEFTSRLPDVGTTIFTVMSRMAAECGAINLSQGFPDFDIDPSLIELVNNAMKRGFNQYAPMPGVPALRGIIAQILREEYGAEVDPDEEITITAGATQALFSAIAAFVGPGDEVILFDPSYDSYSPSIRLTGAIPVHINMDFPQFRIDWTEVRNRVSSKTKMIIVNTPHNPTGTVLTSDDMRELQSIAEEHSLIVLSDEVYDRLIFDGNQHQSVLRFPELFRRSLACFSFGKTLHATGWKAGYIAGPANLMREVRKAHQFIVFSVNTPVQHALAEYLSIPRSIDIIRNTGSFYQTKRDLFLNAIRGSSWVPLKSEGSYFQLLGYENISPLGDKEMATLLTKEHKVASIPVSVFYSDKTDNHVLRFCFAKKDETLEQACAILRKL